MMEISGHTITVLSIVSCFIILLLPKRNAVRVARYGVDPGLFGVKAILGKLHFLINGHSIVDIRYSQAKDEPYYLQATNVDRLILPPRYLPELRMLSSSVLSGPAASVQNTLGRYSGVDIILKDRQSHDICKTRLTKSLPLIVPKLAECIQRDLEHLTRDGNESEFESHIAHKLMLSLNASASSNLYVGPILAQNKAFMDAWTGIQPAIASVIIALTFCPRWLRALIGPYCPPVRRLQNLRKRIQTYLFPGNGGLPTNDFPTILDHYIATAKEVDEEDITAKIALLTTNSLYTLTNAATQALFELCLNPGVVPKLRDEIQSALNQTRGQWTLDALNHLKILDSFVKESSRCNPHGYLGFNRVLLSDVTLSDGLRLPKGQFISFPEEAMLRDAEFFHDPDVFDPFRYYRKRESSCGGHRSYELAEVEDYNLNWGHGKGTCPGRWYAAAMMKLILAIILRNYDVKFPDGQVSRPQNEYIDTMIQPCKRQRVLFKRLVIRPV